VRFVIALVAWAAMLVVVLLVHFWCFWRDTSIEGLCVYAAGMSAFGFLVSPGQRVLRIARPRLKDGILFAGALLTCATVYCAVAFPYIPRALGGAKAELLYRIHGTKRLWEGGYPVRAEALECRAVSGDEPEERRRACVFGVFDAAEFVVVATVKTQRCESLLPPLAARAACYTMMPRERFAENVRGYLSDD
jgi:hypothetical protein